MKSDRTIGPALNRDWIGLRVELAFPCKTGMGEYPVGTRGTVDVYTSYGITIMGDSCPHCGVKPYISRLTRQDLKILTPEEEWPNTQGRK